MNITKAEKEFIAIHRERIKLDSTDWTKEPQVTQLQLIEMSPYAAQRILADPLFRYDVRREVFVNMRNDTGESDVR